jgi:formate hydrogenlyase subunit 3/multisubunit Na+/H+ antiporter MnhD subunit
MIAGVDWDSVNIAGAFVVGAVLATIATIRIFRVVFGERRREQRKDDGRVNLLYLLEVVLVALGIIYLAIKIWG